MSNAQKYPPIATVVTFVICELFLTGPSDEKILGAAAIGAAIGIIVFVIQKIPTFFKKGIPAIARYLGGVTKSFKDGMKD